MRAATLAALATAMLGSATASAQDDPYETEDEAEVFDNRKLGEKQAQESAKERREKYGGDTPFASDEKPDKVEKREVRFSPGIQGGYRAAWGFPGGNLEKNQTFTEGLVGQISLWGDGGYRFIPQLMVGIYLSAGYVIPDCDTDASCSAWDFRGGLQAQWRFLPFSDFTPWVGLGAGWELFLQNASTDAVDASATYHGPELIMIQGGLDVWAPTARGHAGIFVAYSAGRFISRSVSINDQELDTEHEPDNHNWFWLGGRGTF